MKDVKVSFDPEIDFPVAQIRTAAFTALLLFGVALAAGAPHSRASGKDAGEGIHLRLSFETSQGR